jgi:hypothetical protein
MDFALVIASVAALSLTVTKVVDFVRNLIDKDGTRPKWLWNVAALAVGLAFCLGWQINIAGSIVQLVPALAGSASRVAGVSGQVLTGFVVGLGAGFWHELLDALSSIANKNNAAASL